MNITSKLNQIIQECLVNRDSDLFIMPRFDKYQLLYRDAGGYRKSAQIDRDKAEQIMMYIKYRADMGISERRRPQSGAMTWLNRQGELVNLRISTVGDFLDRPSMVIRFIYVLKQDEHILDSESMEKIQLATKLRGLMVFSGPMGSGKTTLIYEVARKLSETKMVMSIEDPVEIREHNFLQLQVNEKSGMSYQELLKNGLRNRPDVFIIGEIRDGKTAEIAIQAALSGHLVLTTVHSKSTQGVWNRIVELGVREEHLKEALTAVIYQRMIPAKVGDLKIMAEIKSFHPALKGTKKKWTERLEEWKESGQITKEVFEDFQYG
ncbi:competence type IV pilus ATPase ComGA [Pediococcus pentosaceus]|uniref:competence type IV pilus ATPase ComGA n=1 Tax=Pediococcus pentosaceus TaxID=1255 RepID=UPI001107CF0E|nr:competence type IV pilus ATPase ComGA [Pediococcus pentosaceus]TLQ02029.1 AAA family ATPase [Pediococcus pentosaceus]